MIRTNHAYDFSTDLIKTLRGVFWNKVYATNAIQKTLKKHQDWDDKKKAVFSDTVYEIVRWWRLLWYLLDSEPSWKEKDLQKLLAVYKEYKQGRRTDKVGKRLAKASRIRAIRESIPDWLDEVGSGELGERWDDVISSLNQTPDLFIRVNTLKTSRNDLITFLRKEGVQSEPFTQNPDTLLLKEKINVFALPSFRDGLFEVQDAGSQMVSRFLDPKPGMRIVDACAGQGSKTLHLSALIENKGKIIALDTHEWRLKELRRRAAKAGVDTIETRLIDSTKVYKRLYDTADRLLLDVPCSGLGTLRRNPDIKWKLSRDDLSRLTGLQQTLLDNYCMILKPEGRMVYSVCSILPSEGEEQVKRFLDKHIDTFKLCEEKRCWPDSDNTDGFYMALIERIKK